MIIEYYEKEVDKSTFAYYTLGLYQMDKMEQLAKVVKKCMDEYQGSYSQMSEKLWHNINNESSDMLMKYPWPKLVGELTKEPSFHDFLLLCDEMEKKLPGKGHELYETVNKVVRVKSSVLGAIVPSNYFNNFNIFHTGISFYIPDKKNHVDLEAFYERFGWAKAAGFTQEKDF